MRFLIFLGLLCCHSALYSQQATSPYIPNVPAIDWANELPNDDPIEEQPNNQPQVAPKTINDLNEITLMTEGGNNPGRLIVQGFHNYRIDIYIDDIPYPRDASGSYNLWYLQTLNIDYYIVKKGLKGFVQLYLYTKQTQSPFALNYSNTALFPASHFASFFSGQTLGLQSFIPLSTNDSLLFNFNINYYFNRYFSRYYDNDIAEGRLFAAGAVRYNHQFNNYLLGLRLSSSFNKTNPTATVTAVNYNTQEGSLQLKTKDNLGFHHLATVSRTAYSVPLQDTAALNAQLYQVTTQHGWMGKVGAWQLSANLDSSYANYNYNNELNGHAFIAGLTPAVYAELNPKQGLGVSLMLGYPLSFSNNSGQLHLVHNVTAVTEVWYQYNHLKPLLEAGWVRRDPNALELYFPSVNNPLLKPEYYAYSRVGLQATVGPWTAQGAIEGGWIINAIATGQRPFNSDQPLWRLNSNLALYFQPINILTLNASFNSTHSFNSNNGQAFDDLVPKYSVAMAIIYQPLQTWVLKASLEGDFYGHFQQPYPLYALKPALKMEYQPKQHLRFYIEGFYTATPMQEGRPQPLTPYGANPEGSVTLGIHYQY